ncbi:MAG: hypothetical protein ACREA9_00010 [Pyrinomonadaceae bacterium]
MPDLFSLDVAFASNAVPADTSQPIVMAYGYALNISPGTWKGQGQTAENLSPGDSVMFTAFDTYPDSTTDIVVEMIISFGEGVTPFVGADGKTAMTSPITFEPTGTSDQVSIGCNVQGISWATPQYTVLPDIPDGTPFECTVVVIIKGGQKFEVDPEMVVEGGG